MPKYGGSPEEEYVYGLMSQGVSMNDAIGRYRAQVRKGVTPSGFGENPQGLANEELLEKLQQQMYVDQARLAGSNYPIYKGKKVAPMSDLTQNARAMRDQYAGKVPKQGKIEALLKQQTKGFSPAQTRNLLDMMRRGDTSEQLVLNRLQKEFGKNFGYGDARGDNISRKIGKDINHNLDMGEANLKNASDELGQLEEKRNLTGVNALQKAGTLKGMRREALMGQLENFGNQKHAFDNLKIQSDRDTFDEEAMAPYRKINRANASLRGIDAEEMHPDKAKVNNALLQKIQNAYNTPHANYPGQKVVPMDPEVEESFRLTQQISPKYKDAYAGERKGIENNLLNNSLTDQIYNKLPEATEPLMRNLDYLTKRQLKKTAGDISGQYARQGTYGSGAHKGALENALREVARNVQAEREGVVLGGLKGQTATLGRQEENALTKHGLMAEEGAKEFGTLLDKYNRKNKTGWEKTQNEQGKENEAIQAWYGQTANEWPRMQNAVGGQGYGTGFSQGQNAVMGPFEQSAVAKGYGHNLTELFKQPALFDENQKSYNAYATAQQKVITDRAAAEQAERQAATIRSQQEAANRASQEARNRVTQTQPTASTIARPSNINQERYNNYMNDIGLMNSYFNPNMAYNNSTGIFTPYGKSNAEAATTLLKKMANRYGHSAPFPSLSPQDFSTRFREWS